MEIKKIHSMYPDYALFFFCNYVSRLCLVWSTTYSCKNVKTTKPSFTNKWLNCKLQSPTDKKGLPISHFCLSSKTFTLFLSNVPTKKYLFLQHKATMKVGFRYWGKKKKEKVKQKNLGILILSFSMCSRFQYFELDFTLGLWDGVREGEIFLWARLRHY